MDSPGSRWPALRCAAPALLLATVALVPFLGKGFNIDDLTFLKQAQHALVDPLHPAAFDMIFDGNPSRVSGGLVSGPVMAYLLVPAVMHGGVEWLAHAPLLLLALLGVLGTAGLALRLGLSRRAAAMAALLVAASPAVLGMASTAMPDVPAMTFGVLAMERLVAFRDGRRQRDALAAGVLFGLAALSRPHLLFLWGCGALALFDRRDLRDASALRAAASRATPFVAAAALVALVVVITRDPGSGQDLAKVAVQRTQLDMFAKNLAAFVANWVLAMPLAVAWAALRGRRLLAGRRLWLALLGGLALGVAAWQWRRLPWLAPVLAFGLAVFVDVVVLCWRSGERVQRVLALWLFIALPTALYVHLPAKYLVPAAPAAAILIARELAAAERRRARVVLACPAAAGVALGVLILRADAAMAGLGRRGAAEYIAPAVARGERVWVDGAWGFQWYAERAGARPLSITEPSPGRGDLVVTGPGGGRIARLGQRRLVDRLVADEPGGRILSAADGAGFYSNGFGYLPWVYSFRELGRIEVWRIE